MHNLTAYNVLRMPPRVTKKPKSKKPRPKLPDDLEFMLGEEISSSPRDNSPPSPSAEAEYSLLTASPRGVLANLRFYGRDGGNNVSSATGSTLSSFQDQNDQNANNIGNITRFISADAIPEEAESQAVDDKPKKSKPKKKPKEKKTGQLNRRESYPSNGHRNDTEGLPRSHSLESPAGNAGEHPGRSSFSAAPRQNELGSSSYGTSVNPAQQDEDSNIPPYNNVTGKSPSKAQPSGAHRRKSSPTKKKSTSGNKRQTIGNDRDIKLLRQISQLQSSTDCLIPKLPFARLIREIIQVYSGRNLRITVECLQCLQEAAEIYAVQVIEDAYRCTLHRDRVTLTAKDMKLALLLRNDSVSKNMY